MPPACLGKPRTGRGSEQKRCLGFGCEHLLDIQSILFPDGFTMFALISVWFLDSALVILGFYIGFGG